MTSCSCTRKDDLSLFERIRAPDIQTIVTDLTGQSCRVKRINAGPQLITVARLAFPIAKQNLTTTICEPISDPILF